VILNQHWYVFFFFCSLLFMVNVIYCSWVLVTVTLECRPYQIRILFPNSIKVTVIVLVFTYVPLSLTRQFFYFGMFAESASVNSNRPNVYLLLLFYVIMDLVVNNGSVLFAYWPLFEHLLGFTFFLTLF